MRKQSVLLRTLLCVALAASTLTISAQTVTKQFKNAKLGTVLKELGRQSKMSVVYKVSEIDTNRKVTANFRSTPVREALNQVLGNDFTYEINDKVVTIHKRVAAQKPQQTQQHAATKAKAVKGTVLDENGEPVIGATIREKGTNNVAVTDIDGNFTISVPESSTVEVSYLGYANKEFSGSQNNVTINMAQDNQMLNEVVVTALGIKKEAKALSYNVQQLNAESIVGVKDASFMNALAGKVAGVEINSSSSGIGGGVKVVMRGAKSISNNNNALYVIDGIPMPSLQTTQPNDYFSGFGQSGDGASMINPAMTS